MPAGCIVTISGVQGERGSWDEVFVGEVSWTELHAILLRLGKDDLHSVHIATEDEMTTLSILLGENGGLMVNLHDLSGHSSNESWALRDELASEKPNVRTVAEWNQGGEYPARQFVDRALAIEAAKQFHESGRHTIGLPWSTDF